MASSFSLISSSTELFSLGLQQRRQVYLTTKESTSPPSPSQLSSEHALPGPWTTTSSSPSATMMFSSTPNFTEEKAASSPAARAGVCERCAVGDCEDKCRRKRARTCSVKRVGERARSRWLLRGWREKERRRDEWWSANLQHLSSQPSVCSSSLRFFKHAARGKEETGGVERKRHNLCTKDTSTTFKGILCLCWVLWCYINH